MAEIKLLKPTITHIIDCFYFTHSPPPPPPLLNKWWFEGVSFTRGCFQDNNNKKKQSVYKKQNRRRKTNNNQRCWDNRHGFKMQYDHELKWATSWENLFLPYANSLISVFVIRCLDDDASSFYIRNFKPLASFDGCADRFQSTLVANPEDRFSRDVAQIMILIIRIVSLSHSSEREVSSKNLETFQ